MANDTSVIVPITADNRPLKQTLTDTTGAIERESRKWDSATASAAQGMEGKMTSMFKAISAAAIAAKVGQTLIEWGKDAIAAASDLEEVQNVVDVTFGESANQINAWAKNAISQFGLTETKAKQFASTLGAMMKSAGMSGPEIVKMSEDLSGLAADMASFYNLDFDTAFQKIRSGISGETEPLKALGINMNTANLNAFALQQGLTKTFEKMSQGEQTMLRYQYLMQATADAQGDFARTSDGYANGLRLLESNIESIKTTVGNMLIPILASATSGLNDFLSSLTQSKPRTVLDDFADIDLKTEEKLAQIQKTATEADALIGTLNDISGKVSSTAQTNGLVSFVNSFSGSLTDLTGALSAARDGDVTGMIDALAQKLAEDVGGDADHWKRLLTTISENLYKVNGAVMWDGNATANWLDAAAEAAESLGGDYSGYWDSLLSVLGDKAGDAVIALAKATNPGEIMKGIAEAANVLGSNSPALWSSLLQSLKSVDGLQNLFSDSNAAGNVASLAEALSGNAPDTTKAEAWNTFLSALSDNADAFSALTQKSPEETKNWLSEIADAANKLTPENAEGWNALLQNFITGLPGLNDSEAGKAFFDAMAQNFLSMGNESEQAKAGLAALGLSTEQINDKQTEWLDTCNRLVQTIPGLSEIINTQTGEVKGGISAVDEYTKAWAEAQRIMTMIDAQEARRRAVQEKYAQIPGLEIDLMVAENRLKAQKKNLDALKEKYGITGDDYSMIVKMNAAGRPAQLTEAEQLYNDEIRKLGELTAARDAANQELERQSADYKTALEVLAEGDAEIEKAKNGQSELAASLMETSGAAEGAEQSMTRLQQAASDATVFSELQADLKNYEDALKALNDYTEKAYQSSVKSVQSTLNGFASVVTPAEAAIAKVTELELKLSTATEEEKGKLNEMLLSLKNDENEAVPTIENMTAALQSQIDHLQAYYDNLAKIKAGGFSADVLAMVSGGTAQDMDYAKALADAIDRYGADSDQVKKLNEQVAAVKAKTGELAAAMTENTLAVDENMTALVDNYTKALEGLNQYDGAKANAAQTVQGIVDGLGEKAGQVSGRVNNILNMLAELSGADYSIPGVNFNSVVTGGAAPQGGTQAVNVNSHVYLDGKEITNNVSTHMANDVRAQERSLIE